MRVTRLLGLHFPEGHRRLSALKWPWSADVARKHAHASRRARWRPPVSLGLPGCGPTVSSGFSRSPEDLEDPSSGTTPRSQVRRLRRNQRGHGGKRREAVVRRRDAWGGGAPGTTARRTGRSGAGESHGRQRAGADTKTPNTACNSYCCCYCYCFH